MMIAKHDGVLVTHLKLPGLDLSIAFVYAPVCSVLVNVSVDDGADDDDSGGVRGSDGGGDDDGDDGGDEGQPSRVLLYALPGWVEGLNISWMMLLNSLPDDHMIRNGHDDNDNEGHMIMIATYEQVEPPDDKKEAEALDLQPAHNRNTC